LWRDCPRLAFPNSFGRRKQVSSALERVRKFRNRPAHHDSMINVDVPFEIRQIIELAAYIDQNAARWLERRSEAMSVYARRPIAVEDTVIVAARNAWSLTRSAMRVSVSPVERFEDRSGDRPVTEHELDRQLYQVFLLIRPGDPSHRQLRACLPHRGNGRGSAFTQRQHYISLH
jgi:hypothetical protein